MIIHVIIMIMIMMINTYWMKLRIIMEIEEDNTLQDIHNSSDDKLVEFKVIPSLETSQSMLLSIDVKFIFNFLFIGKSRR